MEIAYTREPDKVGSVGSPNAEIAFVGEAPGREEVRQGKPFVGASGRLLTNLMSQAGIMRSSCYITNVIKEKLPGNDETHLINLNRKNVEMSRRYLQYEEELKRELESNNHNVIVAVGAIALWALCRKRGITKWRGSILESTLVPGKKVIPIIHPSAALRQYIYTAYILLDLNRIREESSSPEIRLKQRRIHTNPSFLEALGFLDYCRGLPYISYDIEVVRGELFCISFASSDEEAMVIPFGEGISQSYFDPPQEVEIMNKIADLLQTNEVAKIAQNAIFDSTFLFRKYGIVTNNLRDTMIAAGIIAPDLPKGLDFITSVYTDIPYYKDEGKFYNKLSGSIEDFWIYNAKDALATYEAWFKLERDLERQGNLETYKLQSSLIKPLSFMMERGILVDVKTIRKTRETLANEIASLTKELNEEASKHGISDLNPNSPAQLKAYFYGILGVKPYISRTTGQPTTDEKSLKRMSKKGYKEAKLILEIRKRTKLKNTYIEVKLPEDNRLRCSFNPVGTKSGRLSSSKDIFGYGVNMQNLPKEMLKHLLADEGYLIYNVDLSQAENRITAYIAPDLKMIEAFEKGLDVHSITGATIASAYGITLTPEEVKDLDDKYKQTQDEQFECPLKKTWRFWGKKSNHSFNYGEGYKTFAFYTEISETDAKKIYEAYHKTYPGIKQYWRWVEQKLRIDRTLENCFGRKRLFLDRWGTQLFKQAYSFIPQSTTADKINKHGILFLYGDRFKHVELLNQVHDSIVFQIPISVGFSYHIDVLNELKKSLETPIRWKDREFVIPAEAEVGVSLGDTEEIDPTTLTEKELKEIYQRLKEQRDEEAKKLD